MSLCTLTQHVVDDSVRAALIRLFTEDICLLKDDVNERSISHRLALHLEVEVRARVEWGTGLHVDCEYNRDVDAATHPYSKRLNLPLRPNVCREDTDATTVYPDIIVHRRRSKTNRVVIEIKKQGGTLAAKKFDRSRKIPAYLTELGYQFGVFLVLGIGDSAGAILEYSILERTEEGIITTQYPCLRVPGEVKLREEREPIATMPESYRN